MPVALGHHRFADGVDQQKTEQAWRVWLYGVLASSRQHPGHAPCERSGGRGRGRRRRGRGGGACGGARRGRSGWWWLGVCPGWGGKNRGAAAPSPRVIRAEQRGREKQIRHSATSGASICALNTAASRR